MEIMLISMLPLLVPILFLLYFALRVVKCPDCGETLPVLYSPMKKTRRMWRAGGYLCARCGCERYCNSPRGWIRNCRSAII